MGEEAALMFSALVLLRGDSEPENSPSLETHRSIFDRAVILDALDEETPPEGKDTSLAFSGREEECGSLVDGRFQSCEQVSSALFRKDFTNSSPDVGLLSSPSLSTTEYRALSRAYCSTIGVRATSFLARTSHASFRPSFSSLSLGFAYAASRK